MRELSGGYATNSGATVSNAAALEVTAVLACVRVIAEGIAQVPLKIFQQSGRQILPATEHPLYRILHRKPNPWMSSFEMRETMAIHAALTGNAVAFVNRVPGTGRILEIIPRGWKRCFHRSGAWRHPGIYRHRGERVGAAYSGRGNLALARANLGMAWPGWKSSSTHAEAISLALVTEQAHASLHKNGARTSGIYSVEGTLSQEQYKSLRGWIETAYAGAANAGRIMLLDRAAKFTPQSMTGIDAQHLETRRYQVEEICRAFRVMPIMAGYGDKAATYASAEQMFLAHIVHTLAPWYSRIEQSIDCQLLSDKEVGQGYYAKFIAEGMMRGAFKDTAQSLTQLTTNGIMTRNEARENLEHNPIDGLDEPLVPHRI